VVSRLSSKTIILVIEGDFSPIVLWGEEGFHCNILFSAATVRSAAFILSEEVAPWIE
jgi:hypothetical protein